MKSFLSTFFKFILPVALLLGGIELYILYYPSSFNLKARYLKSNADSIETVIFGSSHNQNALNPEYMHSKTANLANAGQDVQLDSALFFKFIPQLKKVKQVILEMDYHTMEEKNDPDYFRLAWYHKFYGIDLYPQSMLNRISVYASSPSFFNQLLIDNINPKKIRYRLNPDGFIINDFPGIMKDLNFDSSNLENTANERLKGKHTTNSPANFRFNQSKLNSVINYCIQNNITVFLVSTPMYVTYLKREISEKNIRRRMYTDSLQKLKDVFYYNFENSHEFNVYDFKNDDHLNSEGAKKFTRIIDSIILGKKGSL